MSRSEQWTNGESTVHVDIDDLGVVHVAYEVLQGILRQLGWERRFDA